jgi:hypothetical protein
LAARAAPAAFCCALDFAGISASSYFHSGKQHGAAALVPDFETEHVVH